MMHRRRCQHSLNVGLAPAVSERAFMSGCIRFVCSLSACLKPQIMGKTERLPLAFDAMTGTISVGFTSPRRSQGAQGIVRNRIYNLLKEQMIRMETKQKYMTVPAAIRELEKIEMVRRNNGVYKLDHAVTKTQKIILSSFGLDKTHIGKMAEEYSRILSMTQSFTNKEEPDDGEEEIN